METPSLPPEPTIDILLFTSSLTLLFPCPPPLYPSLFPARILGTPQDCGHQHTPPVSTSVCVSLTTIWYISTCFLHVNYSDQLLTLEFSAFPYLTVVVKSEILQSVKVPYFCCGAVLTPDSHLLSVTPGRTLVRKD